MITDVGYSVHSNIEKIEGREGTLPTIKPNNVGGGKVSIPFGGDFAHFGSITEAP